MNKITTTLLLLILTSTLNSKSTTPSLKDKEMEGCLTMNPDKTKGCDICMSKYFRTPESEGSTRYICGACGWPCSDCEGSASQCTACLINNYLDGNTCKECKLGCIRCEKAEDNCSLCSSRFYLKGTKCVECFINNCLECAVDGKCERCAEGYKLKGEKSCIKKNGIFTNILVIAASCSVFLIFIVAVYFCMKRKDGNDGNNFPGGVEEEYVSIGQDNEDREKKNEEGDSN